MYINLENIS